MQKNDFLKDLESKVRADSLLQFILIYALMFSYVAFAVIFLLIFVTLSCIRIKDVVSIL